MFKIRDFKGHTIDILALKCILLILEAFGFYIYNILWNALLKYKININIRI